MCSITNFILFFFSARTSTPAITHCTVPTTSAPSPAPTNTATPIVTTPPNSSVPTVAPVAPKPKTRAVARTSGTDTAASTSSPPIQLSDLQNFLQRISTAPPDQQSGKTYFIEVILFLFFILPV